MVERGCSLVGNLPMEIVQLIYEIRLNGLLRASDRVLALGQARFAGVCCKWRAIACAVGGVYYVRDWTGLLSLNGVFSGGDSATRWLAGTMARSIKVLHITQHHSRRRPHFAFVPLNNILKLASPALQELSFLFTPHQEDIIDKLAIENDRSDWKDVFGKLSSKLIKLEITGAVFDADDIIGQVSHPCVSYPRSLTTRDRLLRSCPQLQSLFFQESRNSICTIEEQDQLQLLSTPSYLLSHQLHTLNFPITSSLDASLVAKILATGYSIRRLRLNHDWESTLIPSLHEALQNIAVQLTEFHFNFPLDVNYSLQSLIPLLINCQTLHFDRPNLIELPPEDSLPALEFLSIDTMGYNSILEELGEISDLLEGRKESLVGVHLASTDVGAGAHIDKYLKDCQEAGFAVEKIDPPAW